jgi:hypothetical protein
MIKNDLFSINPYIIAYKNNNLTKYWSLSHEKQIGK